MSTQEILAELPRLSDAERDLVSKALHELAANGKGAGASPAKPIRQAGLHAGAWETTAEFDAPLPEGFWLGEEA